MIRIIKDEIKSLIEHNNAEVLRRYWVFNTKIYNFPQDMNLSYEEENEYIEDFTLNDSTVIDRGKYDKASKVLGLDEWTSLISFIAKESEAEVIGDYITKHPFNPQKIKEKYPTIELIGFYYIDGWWEISGDLEQAYGMLKGKPSFTDSTTNNYIS